ncbi:MAG: thioesterase [Ruminococcus sp.]|nr:thioesterase [Ruminococcus sp.]
MVLFFLPHAGGSAKSYSSFKRFLPKELTVVPMELSGRFTRSAEPLLTDISSCTADLIEKHRELLANEEYAIFGHSMGTLLACELVRQAKAQGLGMPVHVFLSGRCAPDEDIKCFRNSDTATDEEIVGFFAANSLSGASPVKDEELIKQLNRILCTDVRMADSYRLSADRFDLGCDITVLYGTEDIMLRGIDMSGWQRFTSGSCTVKSYSGGHFYYTAHKEEICRVIAETLNI